MVTRARNGRFTGGSTRPPNAGRRRGTPNRATRAVKEFLSEILDRADVQDAIRERILTGDTTAFFKAIEIVHGKPRQALELNQTAPTHMVFSWRGEE